MKTQKEHEAEIIGGEKTVADGATAESDDGIDISLIQWMLGLTPTQRLQAAQDMLNTVWMLRSGTKTN